MSGANPLIAGPVDTATPFSGANLLDDGAQLAQAIESGDWVQGGIAAFSGAIDTAAAVSDPLGTLLAHGLGWLMDHFEPLKGWLNDLTGDAGEVEGFAQTWANVATALKSAGDELTRVVGDVEGLHGEAMDAYRRFQHDAAAHIGASSQWASAMGTGLSIAGTIVQLVHDLVRDVISQLVGSAISWAAEAVFSLGLATPWIIEQVSTRVASLAKTVGTKLDAMLAAVKKLSRLLDELKALFDRAGDVLTSVLRRGGTATEHIDDLVPPKHLDDPLPLTRPDDGLPFDVIDDRPYLDPTSRPSFRKGVVEDVWDRAVRDSGDGKVRDPNTDEIIHWKPGDGRRGVWDMGHIPESKYSEMHEFYVNGDLTPAEFRDWYNDPYNYRPETPGANRSHRYE